MVAYRPLHILHSLECFSGGSKEIVRLLCNHQVQNGHQVTLVCGLNGGTASDQLSAFPGGVNVIPIESWGNRKLSSSFEAARELRRAVTERSPDVVHLHSSIAGFVGRIALSFRSRSVLFYTPHGISLQRPGISRAAMLVYSVAERLANVLHPATYVACSKSEFDRLHAWHADLELQHIDNGIKKLDRVPAESKENGIGHLQFLSVGRLSHEKNQAELIPLKRNTGIDILALGDGDASVRKSLESAGIVVSGWLDKRELVSTLSNPNTVLIQPSLSEGLPLAILEAFSLGLPVIARQCPGHIDVIRHGENGFLYKTTEELIEIVRQLEPNDRRLRVVAENARSEFAERYTAQRMCDEYLSCYRSALV